eukprot:gene21715-26843_t
MIANEKINKLATAVGFVSIGVILFKVLSIVIGKALDILATPAPKKIFVKATEQETADKLEGCPKFDPKKLEGARDTVYMWDPSTFDYLGETKTNTAEEVRAIVARGREAQKEWKNSSFATRKLLLRTMLKFITENQETCAKVAVRESGKTFLDALIGEVLV